MKLVIIITFYVVALGFIFFSKKIITNNRIRIPVISVLGILVGFHMLLGLMGYMMQDRPRSSALELKDWMKDSTFRKGAIGETRAQVIGMCGSPTDTLADQFNYDIDSGGIVTFKFTNGKVSNIYQK